MLDMILLTQVPKKAMAHMEHVSQNVCSWIAQFFQNQPQHTQDAMLGPTNIFASLLERFLRVNRAALDVSQTLDNSNDREQLWQDWVAHVKPLHVLQNSLLNHGHKRVLHILTQEVRFLLNPFGLGNSLSLPHDALFADTGVQSDFQIAESEIDSITSSTSLLARLSRFLSGLATRFPGVDARSLLNYIDVVGNNISRNFTLNCAPSLGNWWRIKLFVDEMSYWLAEKGGFMNTTPETLDSLTSSRKFGMVSQRKGKAETPIGRSRPHSSASTDQESPQPGPEHSQAEGHSQANTDQHNDAEVNQIQALPNQQPDLKQEPAQSRSGSTLAGDDGLGDFGDDSGIGMGLEDDFSMDTKYNNFVQGVHGSDPADVVVC